MLLPKIQKQLVVLQEKSEKDCCSASKNLVLVTILPKNHNLVIAIVTKCTFAH